jgi:hypothetical protein
MFSQFWFCRQCVTVRFNEALRAGRSWDRIPLKERFSAPVQIGTGAYPAPYTMGTGSFPAIKRTDSGLDHSTPSSAEFKKEYRYTSTRIWAFVACFRVNFTVYLLLQWSNAAMQLALFMFHYEVLHCSTRDWQFAMCVVNHKILPPTALVTYNLLCNLS